MSQENIKVSPAAEAQELLLISDTLNGVKISVKKISGFDRIFVGADYFQADKGTGLQIFNELVRRAGDISEESKLFDMALRIKFELYPATKSKKKETTNDIVASQEDQFLRQ